MRATYRLTVEDYAAYGRQRWLRTCVGTWSAVWLVVILIVAVTQGWRAAVEGLPVLAVTAVLLAGYVLFYLPRWFRKTYCEQASVSEERTIVVDEEKASFAQVSGTLIVRWPDVLTWDETSRLLVLYISRAMFVPIVKADVGPDVIEAVKAALIGSGLARPRRRRKKA